MTNYIGVPVITDADALAKIGFDYVQSKIPGWYPAAGDLLTITIEAVSRITAVDATVASTVPQDIFESMGPLVGVPALDATSASVTATFTAVDTAGYTIPAGTIIAISTAGDTTVQFATVADVVIPPASSTATGVTLVALVPGAAGSGLGGISVNAQLVTTLSFLVPTVTLEGTTTGGVDAEIDTAFVNRLSAVLRLLTPRPIIPSDFAALSLDIAGVARALAIDLYQPAVNEVQTVTVNATGGTFTITFGAQTTSAIAWNASAATVQAALVALSSIGAGGVSCTGGILGTSPVTVRFIGPRGGTNQAAMTTTATSLTGGASTATVATVTNGAAAVTNVERSVSVALADINGNAVSTGIKAAVQAALAAQREINFLVYVIDPTFTEIDVTFEITAYDGFDADSVVIAVTAALTEFLSPANWGNQGTERGVAASWVDNEKVRYTDLAGVIKSVAGVFAITTLELAIHGGSLATTDVTLTAPAPLTTVGTISGSHT